MKLETLLQILYANGKEEIVSRAIQIDNNIPMPRAVNDVITIGIHKSDLPNGMRFADGDSYGNVPANIVAINPYKLDKPYLALMEGGKQKWVGDNDIKTESKLDELVVEQVASPTV